jgi:hypothetical protein
MTPEHLEMHALHRNTDDYHLHLVVNRVDPNTHRVTDNGWCIDKLHKALAEIEHKQGWEPEANARYVANEQGEIVPTRDLKGERGISAKAQMTETRTGEKSAERIAQDEAAPIMRKAESWQQLHDGLAERGIRFQQKGSGAVLAVGDQIVKASTAGRDCSMSALEKRLGPYQPPERIAVADRKPEPMQQEQPHWDEYLKAREGQRQGKAELFKSHTAARKQLRENHRKERAEALSGNWHGRGAELNAMRSELHFRHAKEAAALADRLKAEREQFSHMPTYEEFLAERDPGAAQEWRYRKKAEPQHACTLGIGDDEPKRHDIRDFTSSVDEKNGRVIYSQRNSRVGFIDNGKRVDIHDWKDEGTTLAALQLSAQKWGRFQVQGGDEYKAMCVKLAVENGFQITNPELQQAIAQARAERANAGQGQQQSTPAEPRSRVQGPDDAYKRHRDDIRKKSSERMDPSRMDWNVAVRMRVTGYTQSQVEEVLRTAAPKDRPQETRDWKRYAANTAQRVFQGQRGLMNALQQQRFRADLMQLEGRDPREIGGHEIVKGRKLERTHEHIRSRSRGHDHGR